MGKLLLIFISAHFLYAYASRVLIGFVVELVTGTWRRGGAVVAASIRSSIYMSVHLYVNSLQSRIEIVQVTQVCCYLSISTTKSIKIDIKRLLFERTSNTPWLRLYIWHIAQLSMSIYICIYLSIIAIHYRVTPSRLHLFSTAHSHLFKLSLCTLLAALMTLECVQIISVNLNASIAFDFVPKRKAGRVLSTLCTLYIERLSRAEVCAPFVLLPHR